MSVAELMQRDELYDDSINMYISIRKIIISIAQEKSLIYLQRDDTPNDSEIESIRQNIARINVVLKAAKDNDLAVYYANVGYKNILESFINPQYREFVGKDEPLKDCKDFNIIEYGKIVDKVQREING